MSAAWASSYRRRLDRRRGSTMPAGRRGSLREFTHVPHVLSARFVEWLMGLPEGWVTDLTTRNEALKMLGNGVVPQQACAAVLDLLRDVPVRAAA